MLINGKFFNEQKEPLKGLIQQELQLYTQNMTVDK